MNALVTSFGLIFLAEMADKSQLLTLCLACRYPAHKVLLGVTLAVGLLNLLAVGVGGAVSELLPADIVRPAAGALFIGFGIWTLLSPDPPDEETCTTGFRRSAVLAVGLAFFVAEFGDKTQLAALSLAAQFDQLLPVWTGATLAMVGANALAIGGGSLLGTRVSASALRRFSGILFIVFGALTLASALL